MRTFLLEIIPLAENFSTENQRQQDPFQASHTPRSASPFCCLEEPPVQRCQAPGTWQHGGKAGPCWGDGARPRPLCSSQKVRAGARAWRLLWGTWRCFITLLPFTTAAFPLINPPCFVLALSERLFRLPAQLILSPSPVSSFLFPHETNSLTAES